MQFRDKQQGQNSLSANKQRPLFFKYNTLYYLHVKPVGAFFSPVLMLSLSHQPYTALGRRENISRQAFSWRLRRMLSILEMSQLPTGSTKNK